MKKILKGYTYFLILAIYNFGLLSVAVVTFYTMTQQKGIVAFLIGLFSLISFGLYIIVAGVIGYDMTIILSKEKEKNDENSQK